MNLKFWVITDQHAPDASLHSPPVVFQKLSINDHWSSGGTIFQRKNRVMMVRIELNQPLNRLVFTHPTTPTLVTGGLSVSTGLSCTYAFIV